MNINTISQNMFGARFSQDTTTKNLLKEGIQTYPYQVYEAHNFLERVRTNDEISLSTTQSSDGVKYFIQRNNNEKVEISTPIINYTTPIVNILKQLSYTIARGGEDFNKIFGKNVEVSGDFSSIAKASIDKFIDRIDVNDFVQEIIKLENENRTLKFKKLKGLDNSILLERLIKQNNQKIQQLRNICFAKDKEFVSKALRIK